MLFTAYYADKADDIIVFDTNRLWCARMPLLAALFPDFRVIACVRKPKWIINSFETIFRRNPLMMSRLFTGDQGQTVYSRVDALASGDGTFGFAHRALKEAYFGEHADRLIVLDYDALVHDPNATMNSLYRELSLQPFRHDFENITFDGGDEFDAHFGLPGLHRIEPRVQPQSRPLVLPPDVVMRFSAHDFWTHKHTPDPGVRTILAGETCDGPGR